MSKALDNKARKLAFQRLVQLQDVGGSVSASLEQVAAEFQISVSLVRMIEQEGLRFEWPPLGEAPAISQDALERRSTAPDGAAPTISDAFSA